MLKDVISFLEFFPFDMLPRSVTQSGMVIINTDPHTDKVSHWLAINFHQNSHASFFDSYGIVTLVPDIAAFIRRNCNIWDYNRRQMQGLTSNICGKYSCLFALYMDRVSPLNNWSGNSTVRRQQQTDRSSEPSLPNSGRRCEVTAAADVAESAAPAFYER